MDDSLVFAFVLVATSALTVLGVLLIAGATARAPHGGSEADLGVNRQDAVFLFHETRLIDANDRGTALLRSIQPESTTRTAEEGWSSLSRFLAAGFPDLAAQMATLAELGTMRLTASDDSGLRVLAEWLDGTARLTISDTSAEEGSVMLDRLSFRALEEELAVLRQTTDRSPILTWRENALGQVIWANGPYMRQLGDGSHAGSVAWPLPALFPSGDPGSVQRVGLMQGPGARQRWFDITRLREETGQLVFALPADDAQRAEQTKREFVQTLTKTFATLPIGLAVFDRTRRLQLFNPALTDLTGLEPEFLLSRPGIEGFLNRMREKRVLPEPRDYRSWSRRLLDIEKGAGNTEFEETWSLPSGQTFRVSASPHPDGALAFLIEDISSEIHLTRNFRTELETSQSALDLLDAAIAVFGPSGQLLMTNSAFARLWTIEGDDTLGGLTLAEALMNWRELSVDPGIWDQVAGLARQPGTPGEPPNAVAGEVILIDGGRLEMQARRSANGVLLVAFEEQGSPGRAEPVGPVDVVEDDRPARRSRSYRGGQVIRVSA